MNIWYIDFDSTLYDTTTLTNTMLNTIASNIDKDNILEEVKTLFNKENIYNIFRLCEYFEKKYLLEKDYLKNKIKEILEDGSKYVYQDVVAFLEFLKKSGNKINMLTFSSSKENMEYQTLKIYGSGISNYFDSIIITADPKYTLDLKYENGIFVDDNPNDLENLYKANCKKIIRIKRENGKYSNKQLNISKIEEYSTLSEILI